MPASFVSLLAAGAVVQAAASECNSWCGSLLPDQCHESIEEGGCCGDDGFRRTNGTCAACSPQGSSYDYMCSGCHRESACNGMTRAEATEGVCESSGCRGGCLMNETIPETNDTKEICNYAVSQFECYWRQNTWCQACPSETFKFCAEWADCWAVCSGCCSTSLGDCPPNGVDQFPLKVEGPCEPCAHRPPQCDACFPESQCSSNWNATRYALPMAKIRAFHVNVHTTKAPTAPTNGTTTTAAATTAATSSLAATISSSSATTTTKAANEDEAMSGSSRVTGNLLTASLAVTSLLALFGPRSA